MTVVIDGTTGIDAVQNGTVTQADLAANVAGNGPAFSAYASGATNTATSTLTKVVLAVEEFDTANCYDTSLSRFTPNVAGYYQVNGGITAGPYASQLVSIFKNGTEAKRGVQSNTAVVVLCNVSALIYMNGTTDYIELYWYQQSGVTVNSSFGSPFTYFQAALMRAA